MYQGIKGKLKHFKNPLVVLRFPKVPLKSINQQKT